MNDPRRSGKTTPQDKSGQVFGPGPRGIFDEVLFVLLLVMFLRMFIVEIYKIPTGSMTPTLLGGAVSHIDVTGDETRELLFWDDQAARAGPLMYRWNGERFVFSQRLMVPERHRRDWAERSLIRNQFDRILVSKLPYLFRRPRQGEIVVFKVLPEHYSPEAPIYIKRLVGEPTQTLSFTREGRLVADGELVREPEFFRHQQYDPTVPRGRPTILQPEIEYEPLPGERLLIRRIDVPPGHVYLFGDNAHGSLDSRFFGALPIPHVKGRAFLRVYPFTQIRFLT